MARHRAPRSAGEPGALLAHEAGQRVVLLLQLLDVLQNGRPRGEQTGGEGTCGGGFVYKDVNSRVGNLPANGENELQATMANLPGAEWGGKRGRGGSGCGGGGGGARDVDSSLFLGMSDFSIMTAFSS